MSELRKDVILLAITNIAICYSSCFMLTYSYLCALFHFKNGAINFSNFYWTSFSMIVGLSFGSFISSIYFNILGVRIGVTIGHLLNIVSLIFFLSYYSFASILF